MTEEENTPLETYWLITESGDVLRVLRVAGCYNGRAWNVTGHGRRMLGADLFLSEQAARDHLARIQTAAAALMNEHEKETAA